MIRRWLAAAPALAVFLVALSVYWRTACVSLVSYGDSAELITASWTLGVPHAPGYPLYMMIGKLFGSLAAGEVAHRYSLLCGMLGAATVVLVFAGARALGCGVFAASGAALALAFCYHFWLFSLVPEVSCLNGLFTALLVWLVAARDDSARLSRRRIRLLVFLFGLGLTHHHTLLFLLPGLAYVVLRRSKGRSWTGRDGLILAALFVLGLLPYAYIPLAASRHPGIDSLADKSLGGLLRFVTRRNYGTVLLAAEYRRLSPAMLGSALVFYGQCLLRSFTLAGILLAAVGLVAWWRNRRPLVVFLGISFLLAGPTLFALSRLPLASYAEKGLLEKFLQPSLVLFALPIAGGLQAASAWIGARKAMSRAFARAVPALAALLALLLPAWLIGVNFARADKSRFGLSKMYVLDLFRCFEPNALVLMHGDSNIFSSWYAQRIDGQRADVEVVGIRPTTDARALAQRHFGRRPIYVVGLPGGMFGRFGFAGNPFSLAPWGLAFQVTMDPGALRDDTALWRSFDYRGQFRTTDLADWYARETLWFYAIAHYNKAAIVYRRGLGALACEQARRALEIDPPFAPAARMLQACRSASPGAGGR